MNLVFNENLREVLGDLAKVDAASSRFESSAVLYSMENTTCQAKRYARLCELLNVHCNNIEMMGLCRLSPCPARCSTKSRIFWLCCNKIIFPLSYTKIEEIYYLCECRKQHIKSSEKW